MLAGHQPVPVLRALRKALAVFTSRTWGDHPAAPGGILPHRRALPCPCEHGFVRAANGTFTSFDPQDAFYTVVQSMNTSDSTVGLAVSFGGSVAGGYADQLIRTA